MLSSIISIPTFASTETIGPNGISSAGLTLFNGSPLTGAGVDIGQVEFERPGDPSFDTNGGLFHSLVDPAGVFFRRPGPPLSFAATVNDPGVIEIIDHALWVAGLMISSDTTDPDMDGDSPTGVSPGADLYSAGYNPASGTVPIDDEVAITAQHLATLPGQNVRAINMSFAIPHKTTPPPYTFDGNQLLTQFVDWSAAKHDILYIVAGNQDTDAFSVPTDNFNGLSIASSGRVGGMGKYRQVAMRNRYNQDAAGDRTSIDLIAPGENIKMATFGTMTTVAPHPSGTSYAAPHVTGTVALLQEYADERLTAPNTPRWDGLTTSGPTARRHEVMKAVLMNSADKLIDDGTVTVPGGIAIPAGGLLGMERTVVKQDGTSTWFNSDAWDDSFTDGIEGSGVGIPLDEEMGAGHLNARRALQQFATGEHDDFGVTGAKVPVIGWDYGTATTIGFQPKNRYRLNQQLQAGSFISITVAWDREVEFANDVNGNGQYDIGDTFEEYTQGSFDPPADDVINDLNISLLPLGGTLFDTIAVSSTLEGTLEHLFFQIPTTGDYEFWVEQFDDEVSTTQDYAVAWWAAGTGPIIAGDYDGNGIIEQSDYVAWSNSFGQSVTPGSGADGNNNGLIDAADYTVWRDAFVAVSVSVPEPSTLLLFLPAITCGLSARADRPTA